MPFIYLADLRKPQTQQAKELASNEPRIAGETYAAVAINQNSNRLVIISQTCDIVRSFSRVPLILVAPIVQVDEKDFEDAKKGSTLKYLYLPGLEHAREVANLGSLMSVEKAILLLVKSDERQSSVSNDLEVTTLANSVARKFSRFAFPDEFTDALSGFRDAVIKKHDKHTSMGKTLNCIKEIRVSTESGWNSETCDVAFLFLFGSADDITGDAEVCVAELMSKFQTNQKFPVSPKFGCVTYEQITASAYINSVPLDLGYLSRK